MKPVEILSLLVPISVCIIAAYLTYKNSSEIEKLKLKLKAKTDRDDYIFKLLMGYEDQKRSQYVQASRDFLIVIQQLKDETRHLLTNSARSFKEDSVQDIAAMQKKIINSFASVYLIFTEEESNRDEAHEIKGLFLEIDALLAEENYDKNVIEKKLEQITEKQRHLTESITRSVNAFINKVQTESK